MKTSLDSMFKTDAKKEKEGEWYMVNDEAGFLLRRFSPLNPNYKAAMLRHMKPHARKLQDNTIDTEKELELGVKTFVDICLVDWKGIEIDGQDTPFSKDAAIKVLTALPDLFRRLEEFASDMANYKAEVGN